jgi:hypothetical protein
MKLLIAVLILLFTVTNVGAKTFVTYTVASVKETSTDVYTATVDHVKAAQPTRGPILPNGVDITITTMGCAHNPGKDERAVIVDGPRGSSLLFVSGGACEIISIEANTKAL